MRVDTLLMGLLVLSVGTIGLLHALSMDGEMSGCPLVAQSASLCAMSPIEHLVLWQRLFSALPQRALLLIVVGFLLSVFLCRRAESVLTTRALGEPYQAYRRSILAFVSLEPLTSAFSQGILHPKIYESALS